MRTRKRGNQLGSGYIRGATFGLLLAGTGESGYGGEGLGHYPGFMWSQARTPSDLIDERSNDIIEGAIEQGVDWAKIGDDLRLNAFVRLKRTWDEEAHDWNRKYGYSLGGKIRYTGLARTLVSAGAGYDVEKRTESNEARSGATAFLRWGSYWDLAQLTGGSAATIGAVDVPGTTWGELRYPASHFGEETTATIVDGAVEQGVDWHRFHDDLTLNTFARIAYTFDSKDLDWNNKLKMGPGAKFKLAVGKEGLLELGLQYQWHHRLKTNRTRSGTVFFLNWSLAWDFGEFAQKSF